MNSEQIHTAQEIDASNNVGEVEEPVQEAGVTPSAKRRVTPHCLVPALTLIALQFVQDEPSFFEEVIQSIGGGNHRPGAQ